MLEIKSNDISA